VPSTPGVDPINFELEFTVPLVVNHQTQADDVYGAFSYRAIEDLLAERGITVSREAIRLWCINFGGIYARRLKRKHPGFCDTFFIDEVFVKTMASNIISGERWIRMERL